MKTENKIGLGVLIVAGLSLAFSIISYVKSCNSNKKLLDTNYRLSSIEYRPRIKFVNPEIYSLDFRSDSIPVRNSENKDSIGDVPTYVTLKFRVQFTNVGTSSAKLLAVLIADTLSDDMILKEKLDILDANKMNDTNKIRIPHSYIELTPSDTSYLDVEHTVQYISDNTFIIHILGLYINELDQIYDTYYWINYETNDIIIDNPFYSGSSYQSFIKNFKSQFLKSIEYRDENNYSSAYSKKKSSEIIKSIKN